MLARYVQEDSSPDKYPVQLYASAASNSYEQCALSCYLNPAAWEQSTSYGCGYFFYVRT